MNEIWVYYIYQVVIVMLRHFIAIYNFSPVASWDRKALFRISEVICSPGTSRLLFYEFLTNNSDMLLSSHTFLVILYSREVGIFGCQVYFPMSSLQCILDYSSAWGCFPKEGIHVPLKYFPQTALLIGLNVSLHRSPQRTDVGHMTEHTVHRRQESWVSADRGKQ